MAIKTFFEYLDILEKLKKEKEYDKFWAVANQGILDLLKQKDDSGYMIYYQMADVMTKEKQGQDALLKMGLFIHYNLGLGGITHENFVKRLLKKFGKEDQLNHFIKISIENDSEELKAQIIEFINI